MDCFNEDPQFDFYYEAKKSRLKIYSHYGAAPLYFKWSKGKFTENRRWNKQLEYWVEQYRGMEFAEDAYGIGHLAIELDAGESMFLAFTLDKKMAKADPEALKEQELEYQATLIPKTIQDEFTADLLTSGEQFIVKRQSTESHSIIAGYHWFTDWSRDTMISMLGLCIATGKKDTAKSILKTFLSYVDQGMLPNRFPDYDREKPGYNTVDGTLLALHRYL